MSLLQVAFLSLFESRVSSKFQTLTPPRPLQSEPQPIRGQPPCRARPPPKRPMVNKREVHVPGCSLSAVLWTLSCEPTCESGAGRSTVNRPSWGWSWDPCPSPLQGNVAPRSCDDSVTRVGLDQDYLVQPPPPPGTCSCRLSCSQSAAVPSPPRRGVSASVFCLFQQFLSPPWFPSEVCLLQEGSSDACTHDSEALQLGLCTCAFYFEIRATSLKHSHVVENSTNRIINNF